MCLTRSPPATAPPRFNQVVRHAAMRACWRASYMFRDLYASRKLADALSQLRTALTRW